MLIRSSTVWLPPFTSVQVVPLPYPLQAGLPPLTYPLLVPLTLKAWEGLSVRGSQHEG